jgi:Lrp/AsnC family leucine-responsive transcriptional regulator
MHRHARAPALDAFDRRLIDLLQRDNTAPLRELGAAVHLSVPAVQRRLQRLRESGVIAADVSVADPASLGRPLTVVVEVELESHRRELVDAAKRRFVETPEIQQCYYVTGEADFVIVLTAGSMAEYEQLARRLFYGDVNVRRFRTLVVMDRVKVSLAVPTEG